MIWDFQLYEGIIIGKLFFLKILSTNFWQCTRENILIDERNVWYDLKREGQDFMCVEK